jgi:alkylation response protein AidB-like acyl-CoA dehydrogenase
MFTYISS